MTTDKPMTMVERVARAMAAQDELGAVADGPQVHRGSWHAYSALARAAIETMRELSSEMIEAERCLGDDSTFRHRYEVAIDAALKE